MRKIYHLKTCTTCARIIKELEVPADVEFQELKSQPIAVQQLESLHKLAGSYEALFNRRSKLYTERGLKNETLTEEDYKAFILEHYTFLKRPVVVSNDAIFIGNSKKVVEAAKQMLHE